MSGLWHKGDGIYVSAYHFLVVKWRLGVFGLGATASLSFGNLLFYYRQEFPKFFLPVLICHLSQLARYGWIFICWDEIITIYLTENVKIFLIFTLVFKTWATFPDLGRNTLVFCYYWWVVIKQSHIHCHHQYQTEMRKKYGRFRALTMNVMSSMGWPWSVRTFVLFPMVIALLSDHLHSLPVPLMFSELR